MDMPFCVPETLNLSKLAFFSLTSQEVGQHIEETIPLLDYPTE